MPARATSVPPPGGLSTSSVPSSAPTRSPRPRRPLPPRRVGAARRRRRAPRSRRGRSRARTVTARASRRRTWRRWSAPRRRRSRPRSRPALGSRSSSACSSSTGSGARLASDSSAASSPRWVSTAGWMPAARSRSSLDRRPRVGERAVDELARARRIAGRSARARAAARSSATRAAAARRRAGRARAAGARRRRPRRSARATRAAPPAARAARPPAARSRAPAPRPRSPRAAARASRTARASWISAPTRRPRGRSRSARARPALERAPARSTYAALRQPVGDRRASGRRARRQRVAHGPRVARERSISAAEGRGAEEAGAHEPEQEREREQRERGEERDLRGLDAPASSDCATAVASAEHQDRRAEPQHRLEPAPLRAGSTRASGGAASTTADDHRDHGEAPATVAEHVGDASVVARSGTGCSGTSAVPRRVPNSSERQLQRAGDVAAPTDEPRARVSSRPDGKASSRWTSRRDDQRVGPARRSPTAAARRRAGGRVNATSEPDERSSACRCGYPAAAARRRSRPRRSPTRARRRGTGSRARPAAGGRSPASPTRITAPRTNARTQATTMVQRMSRRAYGHKSGMRIVLATLAVVLAGPRRGRGRDLARPDLAGAHGVDGRRPGRARLPDPDQLQRALLGTRATTSRTCSGSNRRWRPPRWTTCSETVTLRESPQRRRSQPSDRDRHRPPHPRRRRRRVLARHLQDARGPHPRRQAPRHVRAQAGDLVGDAYFLSVTASVFVVLLPAASVTTAVTVSFDLLELLERLRDLRGQLDLQRQHAPGFTGVVSLPTDRLSLSFFAVALSSGA